MVTIKVIPAKYSSGNQELAVMQRIQESTLHSEPKHPGHKHVAQLLDHFYVENFGKTNLFIVLELLGPKVCGWGACFLPDLEYSQDMSRQLLLAVDYIHSLGIVHGGKSKKHFLSDST
jgi:serine/threonine protein kinase